MGGGGGGGQARRLRHGVCPAHLVDGELPAAVVIVVHGGEVVVDEGHRVDHLQGAGGRHGHVGAA